MCKKIKLVATLTIFIVEGVIISNLTYGQEIKLDAKISGGMGYSMLGSSFLSMSDLNTKLKGYGYPTISGNFFSVGGGGHGVFNNRWIIGGEGHTLLGRSEAGEFYSNSLIINVGFFDLGYIIYSIRDLRVYPLIGFGAGEMKFTISENLPSLSFDDILDAPGRKAEISNSGFLLNLAFGADYLLNFTKNESVRGGVLFGLRAGYCISPFKGSWKMGDIKISSVPDLGFAGPYIRFMIGGGGFGIE